MADEQIRAFELAEARNSDASAPGDETAPESNEKRVGSFEAGAMLTFAALFDLLTLIPLLGSFFGGFSWACIALWVWLRDLKRPPLILLSGALELIPVLQILPTNIFMVAAIIIWNNKKLFKNLPGASQIPV